MVFAYSVRLFYLGCLGGIAASVYVDYLESYDTTRKPLVVHSPTRETPESPHSTWDVVSAYGWTDLTNSSRRAEPLHGIDVARAAIASRMSPNSLGGPIYMPHVL